MKGFTSRSVLLSLVSTLAMAVVPEVVAQDAGSASIAVRESAQRQMAVREAAQKVQEARLAYAAGRYGVAVDLYRAALKVLPQVPATQKQATFIKDSLADALVANAMDYRKVGRIDEAVEFLKEAQVVSPGHKYAAEQLNRTLDPVRTNPALTPQHVGNVEEVKRLLSLAFGYYDLGNFDKANATFDAVLKIDAYNTAARRGKEMVQKRRSSYFKAAHDAFRSKALADVDKTWEESLPEDDVEAIVAVENENLQQDSVTAENDIASALKEMVIPQIILEGATIEDVQQELRSQIARFEASGVKASQSINLMSDFGTAEEELLKRQVNLKLAEISVLDLLDVVDNLYGISHYISHLGIHFVLSGKDYGPLLERAYTVPPHFFDVEMDQTEDEDNDFASARQRAVLVKRVNPVEALKSMGVSFPKGATARYDARSRILKVRNTLHNQKEIEELVNIPATEDRQISLSITAMEVSEDDLNELGFEWLFDSALHPEHMFLSGGEKVLTGMSDVWVKFGGDEGLSATEGLRSGNLVVSADNLDNLIRTGSAEGYGINNAHRMKAPEIFSVRGVWNMIDVTMIMRGASQKKGMDIMANPRVVFTPGREEQVIIADIKEMFYPESYSAPQIPTGVGENGAVAAPAHPESFIRFGMIDDQVGGVGTVVQVHDATLTPDGQNVTLSLTVTSNEFEGFINWGSAIYGTVRLNNALDKWKANILGQTNLVDKEVLEHQEKMVERYVLTPNMILQPVFKRRLENTKITVGSGSVIVLGGLKQVRSVRYEDKLPILGDLPMVGRLFRTEGSERVRKAYMVFVKTDIIDPSGKVVDAAEPVQQ